MITLKCKLCGKEFDVYKCRIKKAKYCSKKCKDEDLKKCIPHNKGKNNIFVKCSKCSRKFKTYLSKIKLGGGKYCSIKCRCESIRGNGNPKYWLGKKRNPELMEKLHSLTRGKYREDNSPVWKGDEVGYSGLHMWVRGKLGAHPKFCEFCGIMGKQNGRSWSIQWANKSGLYKRNISDWLHLCIKCHHSYDKLY
jgi:hypothetical protein